MNGLFRQFSLTRSQLLIEHFALVAVQVSHRRVAFHKVQLDAFSSDMGLPHVIELLTSNVNVDRVSAAGTSGKDIADTRRISIQLRKKDRRQQDCEEM